MSEERTDLWVEVVDEVEGLGSEKERERLAETLHKSAGPVSAVDPANAYQGQFDVIRVELFTDAIKASEIQQIGHTIATYLGTSLEEVHVNQMPDRL